MNKIELLRLGEYLKYFLFIYISKLSMSDPTSSNIKQLYSSVITTVDDDMDEFKPLKSVAMKFNMNPAHIVIGVVIFMLLISLVTSWISPLLITIFGMMYPSYMSFKVIFIIHVGHPSIK